MPKTQTSERLPWQLIRGVLSDVTDDELREATIQLFLRTHNAVVKGDIDVCVFATQRTANLYFLLTEYGLPTFGCVLVSHNDPSTQLPHSEWEGKRVIILDDTILLGSSLAYTYSEIRDLIGVTGTVSVDAVCIDTDSVADGLLGEIHHSITAVRRDNETVTQYSIDLSATLYQGLVPPVGDFFSTKRQTASSDWLDRGLLVTGWSTYDVTSPSVSRATTFSFTFIPDDSKKREILDFLESLISNISDYIPLIKVRLLGRQHGRETAVRLVPILILDSTEANATADILERLESLLGHWPHRVSTKHWGLSLRHRILQLLLSAIVAVEFSRSIPLEPFASIEDEVIDLLDEQLLETNFGTAHTSFILKAARKLLSFKESYSQLTPVAKFPPPSAAVSPTKEPTREGGPSLAPEAVQLYAGPLEPGTTVHVGADLVAVVTDVFARILRDHEMPERQRIRGMKYTSFLEEYPRRDLRRLNQGVLLSEIATALALSTSNRLLSIEIASLAIDVCLDTGICCSATNTSADLKTVSRSYILGENAILALEGEPQTYFLTSRVSTLNSE